MLHHYTFPSPELRGVNLVQHDNVPKHNATFLKTMVGQEWYGRTQEACTQPHVLAILNILISWFIGLSHSSHFGMLHQENTAEITFPGTVVEHGNRNLYHYFQLLYPAMAY